MTDKDIIKALECCKGADTDCWECELFDSCKFTVQEIMQNALDLINRQQETIETLRNCVEQYHIIRKDGKSPLSLLTEEVKTEAIKEYMKILEEMLSQNIDISNAGYQSIIYDMGKAYEEMVGEE